MDGSDNPNGEAFPEAAAILRDAGWAPHDAWHVFTRGTLVMGFTPCRQHFVVKNWGMDVHGPDTPDDPVEAAQWLVARYPANPLSTEATLETPAVNLGEESVARETEDEQISTIESQEPEYDAPHDVSDAAAAVESAGGGNEGQGDLAHEPDGPLGTDGDRRASDPFDADFEAFGDPADDSLGLGDETDYADPFLLEAEPQAEAPVDDHDSENSAPTYVFGDNLANDRLIRQGQISEKAEQLISAIELAVDEGDSEFSDLQAYVVSNLDASGIFVGLDHGKYNRFVDLSEARRRKEVIARVRSEKIAYIRTAERAEVAAFDPEADWPA